MKIKKVFISTLLIIMFACDEGSDPPPPDKTLLLKLSVDASYYISLNAHNWIIIHDEDGALLMHEAFKSVRNWKL